MSDAKRVTSKVYGSGSKLALVTLRLILYLWRAGVLMARHTYRYSTQIKRTGNTLWPRRAVGMFSGRRSFAQLDAVIPGLKTSWRLLASIEKQLRHRLGIARNGGSSVPLKVASQHLLTIAKAVSQLDGVCNFGTWKHKLKRLAGVNLAAKAMAHLSKLSRRRGLDRRRSDRRRLFKNALRATPYRISSLRNGMNKDDHISKDVCEVPEANTCISWGELIQQNDDRNNVVLKQYNNRLSLYKKVPLKTMSRLWGQFNQLEIPKWLRKPALSTYIWMFNCSLSDAAVQDLHQYRNLSEFFRRELRAGIRPVDGAHVMTSPADGRVLNCGVVDNGALEQVKGVTYSLAGFLGPLESLLHQPELSTHSTADVDEGYDWRRLLCNPANKLYHCIIYLAPGDYHRFHSPADWNVYARRHFPGELFSVNPGVARWLQGLFNFNERAVYSGKWTHGFFSVAAVGATNVGSINVYFDRDLETNTSSTFPSGSYHDKYFASDKKRSVHLKKGQLFGDFNLGSTIVLLFEAPANFSFSVTPGQRLKYGQGIGCFARQLYNGGNKRK